MYLVFSYFTVYFPDIQICICVGETILSQCPGTSLTEYAPLYVSKAATDNKVSSVMSYGRIIFYYFNAENVNSPVFLHCTGEATDLSVYSNTFNNNGDRY